MGSKVCLMESYSLGEGTQNPWPRVSEIHTVPILSFQLKRQILLKLIQGNEEKGFTSFTCLLKTKDPAKSMEIIIQLLSKGFYLAL